MVCKSLVYQWRGGENLSGDSRPVKISDPAALLAHSEAEVEFDARIKQAATAFADTMQLDLSELLATAKQIMQQEMGSDCDAYFSKVVEELIAKAEKRYPEATNASIFAEIAPTIESILGNSENDNQQHSVAFESLQIVVNTGLREPAAQAGESVREWILGLVDDPRARVTGAQQAGEWFSDHLHYLERRAGEAALEAQVEADAIKDVLLDLRSGESAGRKSKPTKRSKEVDPRILQYCRVRFEEVGLRGVCKAIRTIRGQVNAGSDQLRDFWKDLNQVGTEFDTSYLELFKSQQTDPQDDLQDVVRNLLERREELVVLLDRELETKFFGDDGKLLHLLTQGNNVRTTLAKALRDSARVVVLDVMRKVNASCSTMEPEDGSSAPLSKHLQRAIPSLTVCGGAQRLLLVLPEGVDQEHLQQQVLDEADQESTALTVGDADLVACYEAQQLPLSKVAAHLIGHRSDYAKIASRLHTRVDVDWREL
jgi:hypothetical protein